MSLVGPVFVRQHVPLFGIQQEHEPQDDREQCLVDLVWTVGQMITQEFALGRVMRRLKSAQQFVEGVEHLLRQLLANLVLELPALHQQCG